MIEELFYHLDEMKELHEKIRNKGRLEVGDPDVLRYYAVRDDFTRSYMPEDEEGFIEFVEEIKAEYEGGLEEGIEEVREELQPQLDAANRSLKEMADAIGPYLPSSEWLYSKENPSFSKY